MFFFVLLFHFIYISLFIYNKVKGPFKVPGNCGRLGEVQWTE